MGGRGRCLCVMSSCLFPCLPLFSMHIRKKAATAYNVIDAGSCCDDVRGSCIACSLFQIYVSLEEWVLGTKQAKTTLDQQRTDPIEIQLPAGGQNEITELVMSYIGDVGDDDIDAQLLESESDSDSDSDIEINASACQSGKCDSSSASQGSDFIQVVIPEGCSSGSIFTIALAGGDHVEVVVPEGGRPGMKMQIPNTSAVASSSGAKANNATPPKTIQVKIPDDHYGGDMFFIQNSAGEKLEVVVPEGGRPGMNMQVPAVFSSSSQNLQVIGTKESSSRPNEVCNTKGIRQKKESSSDAKKPRDDVKIPKIVVKDGMIHVPIPPGHLPGSMFEVKSSKGAVIPIIVPEGAKPGMILRVPEATEESTKSNKGSSEVKKRNFVRSPSNTFRVTIPQGLKAGDKFEVRSSSGKSIKIQVPKGGKPGMKVRIRKKEDGKKNA